MVADSRPLNPADDSGARSDSLAEALAAVKQLAFVRPLVPYPGWNFGADWDNPDLAFQMRRRIWEAFHQRGLEVPLPFEWYDGLRLNLYLGNDLSRQLYVGGCSEPNEFAFLNSILAPGMVFIDAGANDGIYTLFAARRVGSAGVVWAFEPSRREFARLEENLKLNQLENVRPFQIALADQNGEADLSVAGFEHEGQNTLGAFVHSGAALLRKERVPTRTLDDLVREGNLHKIDVVKIDVEGAEHRVLTGAQDVLKRFRPILLFEVLEAALEKQGATLDELLQLLRSARYEVFGFDPESGQPAPGAFGAGNMIAVPTENALAQRLASTSKQTAVRPDIQLAGPGFQSARRAENFQPYISLVATARNDDHGGRLLERMQIFINGWISQCERYNLPSELIIVEWNPKADRPRLRDALQWPEALGVCQVRFIEVPAEVHQRYKNAAALPLYQMIAKNVGIRRARGRFILATNIDILFSDELVAYLAERRLETGRMYRIDRHDAMGDVPMEASLSEQLEYCRTHLLRINARDGTFPVDDAERAAAAQTPNAAAIPASHPKAKVHLWRNLQGVIDRMAEDSPVVTVTLPVPGALKRVARFYVEWGGLTGMVRSWILRKGRVRTKQADKRADFLHTNACGDFTLAAREHWFDLRGYPEFDLYSMNIDSIFCYCAHYAGVSEQMLEDPMRIYHIEHAAGSGWTPEGQAQLFERLAAKGVGHVPFSDVVGWAEQMRRLNCTMIFNHEDWGLANLELVDASPHVGSDPSARVAADRA